MTLRRFAGRRQHVATFAVVGVVLLVATTIGVHSLFSQAPLWVAASLALYPTLIIAGASVAVAERWAWLRGAPASREPRDDHDADRMVPRWIAWVGDLVSIGLFIWFGDSWDDHWHRVYPSTPSWMFFASIIVLAMLAAVFVEAVLAEIVERMRRARYLAS
jgi:hypothetical protein